VVDYSPRGAWFPEALGEAVVDVDASAWEDTNLITIPTPALLDLFRVHPELLVRALAHQSERKRTLERRVKNLLFYSVHARLALILLELALGFGVRDSRGTIVNLRLTHRELASIIGATRETVSFAVLDLRRHGLILSEGKRIILLDVPGLRRVGHAASTAR
jgi:CRP/FNR family transcriptional regulator